MSVILIISPEPWAGHFVSKHHYTAELARRGHDVLFFGPPETGGAMRVERVSHQGVALQTVHAPKVLAGLRFLPNWLRRKMENTWLKKLETMIGKPVDVVWLFENSRFFDMSFAEDRLKIYHQVDLNQDFNVKAACLSADFVFCTSQQIRAVLTAHRPDVTFINHGTQVEQNPPPRQAPVLPLGEKNCVYAGNMSIPYLDGELILKCVDLFPSLKFHFFGGFKTSDPFAPLLEKRQNVFLYGKVPSETLPIILRTADILIVAYKNEYLPDLSNPHKLMEYMMSGTVCVSTFTEEYQDKAALIQMTDKTGRHQDFLDLFAATIDDLEHYNAPERRKARRDFALDNTYPKQLDRIIKVLGPRGDLIS